eukprot:2386037-Pleurochrysis_carterae.AAC.2
MSHARGTGAHARGTRHATSKARLRPCAPSGFGVRVALAKQAGVALCHCREVTDDAEGAGISRQALQLWVPPPTAWKAAWQVAAIR